MKIGIIVEPYEEDNASGIAQCILKQAVGLLEMDKKNEYIIYTTARFKKDHLINNSKNILVPRSFLGKNLWFIKNTIFNREIIPDVLIFNMPLLPLVLPRSIKTIPIFYELIYSAPDYASIKSKIINIIQRILVSFALKNAIHILTPSDATRNDILSNYKLDRDKVSTSYPGYQTFAADMGMTCTMAPDQPYFLFIGKIKFKKNIHNIVDAFIKFKNKYKTSHKLYLVGVYGGLYYKNIKKLIEARGLIDQVLFLGFVSNEDVYNLYKNTDALIFCTLKEGFGMPVIEAMATGVPVITSRRPPLDEVSGGAALLVDPENTDEIAEAMFKISDDKELRARMIKYGVRRSSFFSWDKHIQEIFNIIKSIQ